MFDDDYEDRMHDIRVDEQIERQEKPVTDAAQKAVEKALDDELGATLRGLTDADEVQFGIAAVAAHVLAVLSETHAVVELPEPQETYEGNDDENGWQLWASPLGEGPLLFEDGELHYLGVTTYDMEKPEALAASLLAVARSASR